MAVKIPILREIEVVPIDSVFPYPENPREIDSSQFDKLKLSLVQHGFIDPLVINKRSHSDFKPEEKRPTIVGGNMRWRAAKELEMPEVPVGYIDVDRNQERIINIALNRIAGKWDIGKLEKMVYELSAEELSLDLETTGLEDWELKLYNPAEDVDIEEIEKIIGSDDKPTYVLKVVFASEEDYTRAARIISGDNRFRKIVRGEKLLEIVKVYEAIEEQAKED